MARNSGATKFASVNLNQSYGKPPQQAASSPGIVGSGGRSRLPGTTHGGMLLLTRPTRPQPAGQKNPKLAVPRPVNLPSLRREHAGNDPTVTLVGGSGASGWIKQQQQISEDVLVDSVSSTTAAFADTTVVGKASGSSWGLPQQSTTLDGELRLQPHQASGGRSGVYTPPGARTQQANATPYSSAVAPPPIAVEKAVLLRGEEFPTLQASLPTVPAPPQQRQKELQQKQRDKQRELKEQQEKLHQLTQKQHDEDADKIQQLKSQPQPVLSLQPQLKHDQAKESQNEEKFPEEGVSHAGEHTFREEGRSLPSGPAPLIRINHISNWADDERDVSTDLKSQEATIKPQEAAFLDWIDREPEPLGFRRPFQREIPSNFGRNIDFRKGSINNKEGSHGWKQNHVKESAGHGNARDSSFRQETNVLKDNTVGVEGGYGRDSTFGRERTFGKDSAYTRSPSFGLDGGGFTRDEKYDKAHTFSRDEGAVRGGSFGMDTGMQAMDIGGNREMSLNKEVYLGRHGSHNKGASYDQDSHGGMNGYTNSRAKSFDRENYGGGMGGVKGRDLRESYGGMNGQNKDLGRERETFFNRDGFNAGRPAYRGAQGSFGRDGIFSKASQNGDFDGAKTFNRFRNGGGRDSFQEFGILKAGRVDSLDNGRGRTSRSKLHSADPYTRAFTEFVGVDYRATSMLGLEIFESKGLRRKKDIKESTFRDLERESFEAELERVQKLLEEDRQRKIEEQERAVELARKEQEERERLAKEEEERQLKLEEEAREAAAKAEQEALEAVRKAEEIRRAREEEKQQMLLEDERRKENARRKLLELEERIAKRESESKRKEEEELGQLHRVDRYHEVSSPRVEDTMGSLEDVRGKIYSVDQDDDDRAPLRPPSSERSSQKFKPLHSGPSRIKSPDVLNQQIGGYDVTLQQSDRRSGSLDLDTSRVSPWRRGPSNNDVGTALTSKKLPYFPDDGNSARPSPTHDHGYHARKFNDWEPPHGSSYRYSSGFAGDRAHAEKPARKDQIESSYEGRQNLNDDATPQMKYSNGHLRYSDFERGLAENIYANRDSDRPRYKDKMVKHPSWEGRPPSPLSPPSYYHHGTDLVENLPSGRLRQSLPKQPRVPPPPLQAYQKSFPKSTGGHAVDYSTRVHHETGTYSEQDSSSKEQDSSSKEHSNVKSRQLEDLSHEPLSTKLQQETQSSSSELELDSHQPEKSQHTSTHLSEPISSLESVIHSSTFSSKLEPVAKPLVESHAIRSEEEDSGEDGDEEMLEDSEAAEYEEEEASYEEKGEFEEEEEDDDDLKEEKVVGYSEDLRDEVQESLEGELLSGDVENSKNDKAGISVSEIAVDSLLVVKRESNDTVTVDAVTADELLEQIPIKVQHQSVPLNDLHSHDPMRQEILLDSTVGVAEQLRESSEVHPKQMQELLTPSSSPFQLGESMESHMLSSSIPLIQEQHPDRSTITQPATLLSASPLQPSSPHAPSPVVQNHLEVPMTLQFGLLPSTSLVPASVPAIQIGSIQMPLPVHMHSHLSPHVTHYHPSHASPFQFGQLGHPIALSQLLPSFGSQAQPVVQTSVQIENVEQQQSADIPQVQSLMPSFHQHFPVEHLSPLGQHGHQPSEADKTMPEPVRYFEHASHKAMTGSEDEYSGKKSLEPALQMDDKVEKQSSIPSGKKENQVNISSENDSSKRIYQHMSSADAAVESGIGLHRISRMNSERRKNEGGSWQRVPGNLQSEAGNLARGTALGVRERENEKDWHLHSETSGNNLIDARYEGNAYRGRSNRRSSSRRSEFRPRETRETFVADERPASASRQSTRERFLNSYGIDHNRNRIINDKVFQKDGSKSQGMHERRFSKDGKDNPGVVVGIGYFRNSGGKTVGSDESAQKNLGQSSGGSSSRSGDGLLGRFGAMEDVPVQSGVVHVFEQPGIEIPGDEDDFIEVRSKRQMLNDRREQREKEIKAKSKAKEQVVRKQKSSVKQVPEGDLLGSKHSTSLVSERKNLQLAKADAVGSSSTRLAQSGAPTGTLAVATALATSNSPTPSVPTITSGLSDTVLDKKTKVINSGKTTPGAGLPSSDGDTSSGPIADILAQENIMASTHAWGGTRSSQQVVSLTQIQLEEVLKPVRYDLPLQPQLSLGEHGIIGLEVGSSSNSLTAKERSSASVACSIIPPLNGEKIQFGAVTSTYVSPISRPNTPSILGAVGSSVAFRSDTFTDANELRKKLKQLPGTEDDVANFGTKSKRNREDGRRSGGTLDSEAEAEAEAAASAVAVAAISNDDPVNNAKYGASQSNSVSGVLNSATLNGANLGGHVSSSISSGIMLGVPNARPVITPSPVLEDSMTVALPADLSVDTHSFSLGGPPHSGQGSSGLLLPSLPLPSLPSGFPGLDLGPMIGGHMFAFGAGSDVPTGLQGGPSGCVHEQGAANLGLSIAGWQQHVGGSDSYYGAPHGFAGPFMTPAGAVPNLQAPHHMLVYTNPFASIGQFGQLGVSFMGPTYIQSGKQPDWTHTPVPTSNPGLVSMSAGELGGLGGVLAAQRSSSGVASPIQRLAPGPSVVPVTPPSGPFDFSREGSFQIPTVEVSMQPQWSHVSVPHLQSMPTTGPLLGYSMQSRQSHGSLIPVGHLQHAADASNNIHIVPSPNPLSASSFQSIDASAQFPDELGLGDSISTTSIPVSSYVGQQLSSKGAVGSAVSTVTSAAAEASKMQRGRRPRMARGGGTQGNGEGTSGSHAGLGTSSVNPIGQPPNEGRSSPVHLQPHTQMSLVMPGQHTHHVGFVDQKATSQLLRPGVTGGWSGQVSRKVGVPTRPQLQDRGISSEKSFVSSAKLKQVYVVKPSASYKGMGPNSGESVANMFVHEMSQTGIDS